tara:strand:- start:165 stop:536 length:372 start_codon:yes stop_codon:yes gene_type:complete
MNIISFFQSDYNFSATLAKVCDVSADSLFFENKLDSLKKYSNQNHKVIIIDLSDYRDSLEMMIQKIRNSDSFIVYGLISKMDIKLQKQAIELGFDMVMTKSNFLHNFKTIQKQILNISKASKT